VQTVPVEFPAAGHELSRYREHLASGSFDTVIQQSRQVASDSETDPHGDLALYALGLVYADPAFTGRDAELSRQYFAKLIRIFPKSPLVLEAKIFMDLYDAIKAATDEPAPLPRPVAEDGNFEEEVRKNENILQQAGAESPADEALYNLGLIYAHSDNPARDYRQARDYFARIPRDFPASPLAKEARVWLGLFEVLDKMRQINLEIEEQKRQLTR